MTKDCSEASGEDSPVSLDTAEALLSLGFQTSAIPMYQTLHSLELLKCLFNSMRKFWLKVWSYCRGFLIGMTPCCLPAGFLSRRVVWHAWHAVRYIHPWLNMHNIKCRATSEKLIHVASRQGWLNVSGDLVDRPDEPWQPPELHGWVMLSPICWGDIPYAGAAGSTPRAGSQSWANIAHSRHLSRLKDLQSQSNCGGRCTVALHRNLSQAMRHGRVVIVTNAADGWIETSCAAFMPGYLTFLS